MSPWCSAILQQTSSSLLLLVLLVLLLVLLQGTTVVLVLVSLLVLAVRAVQPVLRGITSWPCTCRMRRLILLTGQSPSALKMQQQQQRGQQNTIGCRSACCAVLHQR